jgi:putative transposase
VSAEADRHRQASLLWRSTTAVDANRRASITQGVENRAENSHLPLRKRERVMQRFRSSGALQRFVSVFSAIRNLFVPAPSKRSAIAIHLHRLAAMAHWKIVTGTTA